jgi:GNAT superfamily N-acetyltransferase
VPAEAARVRSATSGDASLVARLLHEFNAEFEVPTPAPAELAPILAELIEAGEATVLLGEEDQGLAVLRWRPSLYSRQLVTYLEELYVVPARRGEGLGRALLEATIAAARDAGAERVELGTSTGDTAARSLYESAGFTNLEDGETMLFYELEF